MEEDPFRRTSLNPSSSWPKFLTVFQLVQVCPGDTIRVSFPYPIDIVLVYLAPPHRDAWLPVCGFTKMFAIHLKYVLKRALLTNVVLNTEPDWFC